MRKASLLLSVSFLLLAFSVSLAHAQTGGNIQYTPLEPGVITSPVAQGTQVDFSTLILTAFRLLFSLGALLAVGMITFFGIQYMVSDIAKVKMVSTERLWAAALGLGILAGSYLILNTINPDLLQFKFDLNFNRAVQNSSTQNVSGNTTYTGSNSSLYSSGGSSGTGLSSSGSDEKTIPGCGNFTAGGHLSFYPKSQDAALAEENAKCAKLCQDLHGALVEVGRHEDSNPELYSITYQCQL